MNIAQNKRGGDSEANIYFFNIYIFKIQVIFRCKRSEKKIQTSITKYKILTHLLSISNTVIVSNLIF